MKEAEQLYWEGFNDGQIQKAAQPKGEQPQLPEGHQDQGKEPPQPTDARRLAALIRAHI